MRAVFQDLPVCQVEIIKKKSYWRKLCACASFYLFVIVFSYNLVIIISFIRTVIGQFLKDKNMTPYKKT